MTDFNFDDIFNVSNNAPAPTIKLETPVMPATKAIERNESKRVEPKQLKTKPVKTEKPMTGKLVEWFDSHYYQVEIGGMVDHYPSVTTILQAYPFKLAGLSQWRGDVGNQTANQIFHSAGDHGTIVHNAFDRLLKGTPVFYRNKPEEHVGEYLIIDNQYDYLQLWKLMQFMERVKPEVILNEYPLVSHEHKYAGTMDLLLRIQGGTYLIDGKQPVVLPAGLYIADIKTSSAVHNDYYCQIAAYAKAYTELTGEQITGGLILHTKASTKSGIEGFSAKYIPASDGEYTLDKAFEEFLRVYNVWKINPTPGKPRIFQMPEKLQLTFNYYSQNSQR